MTDPGGKSAVDPATGNKCIKCGCLWLCRQVLLVGSQFNIGVITQLFIKCIKEIITIFAPHTESFKAKQALTGILGDIDFEVDEIQYLPQNTLAICGEDVVIFERFIELLEDLEDVQNIYHNAEY